LAEQDFVALMGSETGKLVAAVGLGKGIARPWAGTAEASRAWLEAWRWAERNPGSMRP